MSKNPNTLIITGACGFIGRHLLERLQDYPGPVLAVDRIEPKARFPESIRFHRSDLMDPSQLIPSDLDISDGFVLIHLAWDMRRGRDYAAQMAQTHLLAALLDHWTERGLLRLVGMGTAEEYGRRSGLIHESDPPLLPLSPYGLSKRTAGLMAASWGLREGRSAIWLRPFIAYGAGQGGDMLLPYAVTKAKAREVAEFTDGLQERDFVHVNDVADAIRAAIDKPLAGVHTVNIGTGAPAKVRDVLAEVAKRADAEELFRFGARPRRAGEPERQVADISAARDLLGWTPKIGWREGIAAMVESG